MLGSLAVLMLASSDPFLGDGHHGSALVTTRQGFSPSVPLTTSASAGATAIDLTPTDLGRYTFVRLGPATSSGFEPGAPLELAFPSPDTPSPRGGFKGERFFRNLYGTAAGPGRAVTGGGGGNCHSAGGGAGSHVGQGGQGGYSWDSDGTRDVGGRGGARVIVPDDRLTFGGGGAGPDAARAGAAGLRTPRRARRALARRRSGDGEHEGCTPADVRCDGGSPAQPSSGGPVPRVCQARRVFRSFLRNRGGGWTDP
ncbi:MAG: hypothetical protein JNK82_31025 [Myxococcaceae bacterium]|nr:hypothetical protein [Myxococcaceae bacterium]